MLYDVKGADNDDDDNDDKYDEDHDGDDGGDNDEAWSQWRSDASPRDKTWQWSVTTISSSLHLEPIWDWTIFLSWAWSNRL